MIKWALLGWLSSSLTDQLIRLISSRDNWQSLHHHHSYKQTSEAQVNQVMFNRSPPPFLKWTSPFKSISHVFVFLHPNWNKRALIELEASRSHNCANIQFAFLSYFGFFFADQCRSFFSDLEVSKATYANHYSESKWMKDFWFTSFIDSVAKSPPTLHF